MYIYSNGVLLKYYKTFKLINMHLFNFHLVKKFEFRAARGLNNQSWSIGSRAPSWHQFVIVAEWISITPWFSPQFWRLGSRTPSAGVSGGSKESNKSSIRSRMTPFFLGSVEEKKVAAPCSLRCRPLPVMTLMGGATPLSLYKDITSN